jgi:hypothetical protein
MTGYSRGYALVVAMAVALLASACTAGAPSTAAPDASPQAIPSSSEDLRAGTYTFDNSNLGLPGKPVPSVVITVPDGWSSFGYGVHRYTDTPRYLAVSFWSVRDVYANGCHWLGPSIHPGPTVDDLAAVLAARPLRNATAPLAVNLGGYHGKFLEWSVPVDIRFDAASQSFSDCDQGNENGPTRGYFKTWIATDGGDRYQQGPGQVDRLWILDIQGHRLVIDATYMPATSELDQVALRKVVDSIAFKP